MILPEKFRWCPEGQVPAPSWSQIALPRNFTHREVLAAPTTLKVPPGCVNPIPLIAAHVGLAVVIGPSVPPSSVISRVGGDRVDTQIGSRV